MRRKSGLGRGLEALIPGGEMTDKSGVDQIPVEQIQPNPRQPRSQFNESELQELAGSIREHGIIQPLILTRGGTADQYVLIAGERRLMAARLAGLQSVPALVREAGELQRLELALIENVQRSDLNALEEAEAYRQLADDFSLSHEEIAQKVGKSRAAVTNTLRLLKLPVGVQKALLAGEISAGHARALLGLSTPQAQSAVLGSILKRHLSVRQTEELVEKLKGERKESPARPPAEPQVLALQERLQDALGTRVDLVRRSKGWTMTIHSYSDEELNAILEKILGKSTLD